MFADDVEKPDSNPTVDEGPREGGVGSGHVDDDLYDPYDLSVDRS